MTNRAGTLYTGVTSDVERRVYEHRHGVMSGFTSRYNVDQLIYYETTDDVRAAVAREKQIKGWLRKKKVALVESVNPEWDDLSETWFTGPRDSSLRSERHSWADPRWMRAVACRMR